MKHYFAPMEGLTDSIYRRLHRKFFPGVDRYYTPFFSPTSRRLMTPKESRELPIAVLLDACVVPQILTKSPGDFCWMTQQCEFWGYREVNLNLGCPSGTVTSKGKGSAMLRDPDALDEFFDEVFLDTVLPVSVKTRIGFSDPEEWVRLLEVFNRYPIAELTVHPRVKTAMYKGDVDMEAFAYTVRNAQMPLCYNGDLQSLADIAAIEEQFPSVGAVMLGRGLIADPGMFSGGTRVRTLERFYKALTEAYVEEFGGARNAMFRMKEHWGLLQKSFEGGDALFKRLRKTTDLEEYKAITQEIFHTVPLKNK